MTKTELIEVIRGIVKEEVKLAASALRSQLLSALSTDINSQENHNTIQTGHTPPPVSRPFGNQLSENTKLCSNPIINEVLLKTKGGIQQDLSGVSFNPRELMREGAMPIIPQNANMPIMDQLAQNYDEESGVRIPPNMAAKFNSIFAASKKKKM